MGQCLGWILGPIKAIGLKERVRRSGGGGEDNFSLTAAFKLLTPQLFKMENKEPQMCPCQSALIPRILHLRPNYSFVPCPRVNSLKSTCGHFQLLDECIWNGTRVSIQSRITRTTIKSKCSACCPLSSFNFLKDPRFNFNYAASFISPGPEMNYIRMATIFWKEFKLLLLPFLAAINLINPNIVRYDNFGQEDNWGGGARRWRGKFYCPTWIKGTFSLRNATNCICTIAFRAPLRPSDAFH